VATTRTEDGQK